MDKELDKLHDLARAIIKQQFDKERALQAAKDPSFSDSRLKKIRKVMTQLDQNHKIYADQMDNILSQGGSTQYMGDQLRSAVRGVEEYALEAFKLLEDDSVHHKIQSRTGGDTLIEAPGDRVRRVMARLEDHFGMEFGNAFGPGGNLTADMSLSNRAHKWDERARGLEKQSGVGKEPTKATTAHRRSTAGSSKNLTAAQLADDDSLFEALRGNIQQQLDDAKVGGLTDAPRQELVRALTDDPMAYNPAATAEDVAATKSRIAAQSAEDLIDTYRGGYGLEVSNGSIRFNRARMTALAGAGLAGFSMLGTAASAAETVGRGQIAAKTKNPMDYLQTGLSAASLAADFVPVAGEIVSTPADALNVLIDTIRDPKSLAEGAMKRRQQERKEKLQSKPADAPERIQSLSAGFAKGGF
jgi:hypothetical protein